MNILKLEKSKLIGLLKSWNDDFEVIVPTVENGNLMFGNLGDCEPALDFNGRPLLSPKEFMFPQIEKTFSFNAADNTKIGIETHLSWGAAFWRGVGCNWLVCLAVWMAISSDDIAGKIAAIWWPIMAFVALGMEHCVANMFFIPSAIFCTGKVTWGAFLVNNLIPVTLGNIVGGAFFVGMLYWWVYQRGNAPAPKPAAKPDSSETLKPTGS